MGPVYWHGRLTSTNDEARRLALLGAPAGTMVITEEQTAGRGQQGRTFYSPPGSGLYLSIVLRPVWPWETWTRLTPMAAVAVAEAIEEVCGLDVDVKWVNDLYRGGRKIGGILCESMLRPEASFVVVGIGLNVEMPAGGFPAKLQGKVGALFAAGAAPADVRKALALRIREHLAAYVEAADWPTICGRYDRRCLGGPRLTKMANHGIIC